MTIATTKQARTPYVRIPAEDATADRELQKIERAMNGLWVPKVITGNYTVVGNEWMLVVDATTAPVTVTFPAASQVNGLDVVVVKSDASAHAVTLSGTFGGVVNPTLASQGSALTIRAGNGVYYYPVTSITGTAGKVANALSVGTHLSLSAGPFDGSAADTLTTDATSANTASTIAARDASGISGFKGIQFPATQSPSADPNCLDDYEEGNYTATLTCGTSGTITLSTATLRYTKVGRLVTIGGDITVGSISAPVGTLLLSLPFTAGGGVPDSAAGNLNILGFDASFTGTPEMFAAAGTATAFIGEYAGGTTSYGAVANKVKASAELIVGLTYNV